MTLFRGSKATKSLRERNAGRKRQKGRHATRFFGKAVEPGSNGKSRWWVRIPMWVQSTILIFSIGLISLLVLAIVAGFETWRYSEALVKERLSNFAVMMALQVEETFAGDQSYLLGASSGGAVLQLLRHANQNNVSVTEWINLERQLGVQFAVLEELEGMVLYDRSFNPVYTYRRRLGTAVPYRAQTLLPDFNMYPLSTSSKDPRFLMKLNESEGGVLAPTEMLYGDLTAPNITYSVSRTITSVPVTQEAGLGPTIPRRFRGEENWFGYCTYIFRVNYSFTRPSMNGLFDKYRIITVKESTVNKTNFTLLIPNLDSKTLEFHSTYPSEAFPAVQFAKVLADQNENSTASQEKPQPSLTPYPFPPLPILNGSNHSRVIGGGGRPTNGARLDSAGTLKSKLDLASDRGDDRPRQGRALMRTRSPYGEKVSIGYSYANVFNERWLIFVEISQSEAFLPASHLRTIVIGVGIGILGAVLLILLPLSRLQTRAMYTVYQNMKLHPMFQIREDIYADQNDDDNNEQDGDDDDDDVNSSPEENLKNYRAEPNSNSNSRSSSSDLAKEDRDSSNSGGSEAKRDYRKEHHDGSYGNVEAYSRPRDVEAQYPSGTTSDLIMTTSHDSNAAKFRVPFPLPDLGRWYTDELDDLVHEYNNMVHKLSNQYLHLEDQVRMRTREAQRAREVTEKANAAKSEFIAIISHELRTPLNGIMGLTSVSVEETDIETIRGSLRIIIDSGRVLMGLLNELLELSKILVGVDPILREFTPAYLLEMLPNMFESRSSSLRVTFAMATVPQELIGVKLKGDSEHIIQVTLNFMSNAMKFSETNGTVSIILHLRPLTDPHITTGMYDGDLQANAILEILVTDSGEGMSISQLAKVFDLFVQGDDPLRKKHRGAGLGMAVSKQLAEGIGGYVAVFSAEKVGSTVALRVPVEVGDLSAGQIEAMNGPPIEFKVQNVYSTLSYEAGKVTKVAPAPLAMPFMHSSSPTSSMSHPIGASTVTHPIGSRKSRHAHQSSSGSRMLLTKAHPVTRLLRSYQNSQSLHQHHNSAVTSASSSSHPISEPRSGSPSMDMPSGPDAVSGTHSNGSASSLLLNIPAGMFEEIPAPRTASFTSAQERPDMTRVFENRSTPSLVSEDQRTVQRERSPKRRPPPLVNVARSSASSPIMDKAGSSHDWGQSMSVPGTASSDIPMMFVTSPEVSPTSQVSISHDLRVLVVEDNPLNQQILTKMLSQMGVKNIETAGTGREVIKLVEKSIVGGYHFALILMDLNIPEINGIDATHIIRTTLGYPYPIVALTGFSDVETREACMAVNVQEVLTKPVMRNDLYRIVQKYGTIADDGKA